MQGQGAYYVGRGGNRYSSLHQLTVYCAEDPLVAIAEGAYYQALNWQKEIASSRTKAVQYPLRSEHLLWGFRIDPLPSVIDMESALAINHFAYSPHVLLNPSRTYIDTQEIANDVRAHTPPNGSGQPKPEGMKIPSVRAQHANAFQPHHLALFVVNTPGAIPFDQRSQLAAKMKIEFEFFTHTPTTSVAYQHARIGTVQNPVAVLPNKTTKNLVPA